MYSRGIKTFEEFLESPFIDKDSGESIDIEFMLNLSKPAQNIIRYMVKRKAYLEDKFLFDVEDFNKFAGYKSKAVYLKGVIDLILKNVLAKTRLPHLYWVNKNCLNESILIDAL